jgi:hypothetical protein
VSNDSVTDRHAVMTKGIHNGECIRIPDPVSCCVLPVVFVEENGYRLSLPRYGAVICCKSEALWGCDRALVHKRRKEVRFA